MSLMPFLELCPAVCPMRLRPYEIRGDERGFLHTDCIKCGRCVAGCPLKVPEMARITCKDGK